MLSQIRMMAFYELLHSNGSLLFLLQHFFKNQTFNMNKRNVIIIYCIIYLKAHVHQCKRYCVLHCILHRQKIQQLPNQNAGTTPKQQHKHALSLGWTLAFKNNNKTMVFYFQIKCYLSTFSIGQVIRTACICLVLFLSICALWVRKKNGMTMCKSELI